MKHPVIGSAYQPTRLVRRGPTHFSALRQPLTSDDSAVQEAILKAPKRREPMDPDRFVFAAAIACAVVVATLIYRGVIT